MISLKEVYELVIKEQDPVQTPPPPPTPTPTTAATDQNNKVIDFPKQQFTLSLFPNEKKLIFTPKKGSIRPTSLRSIINQLKNNFNISNVKSLSDGVFEVILAPTENIGIISDFIQKFTAKP